MSFDDVLERVDRLYAELGDLKRQLILRGASEQAQDEASTADLDSLVREVSALWSGPDAIEEIRYQREK